MARVTVEDCLGKAPNRFALVMLVARRARQLERGAEMVVYHSKKNHSIVNALREVAAEAVGFDFEGQAPGKLIEESIQ